MENPFLQCKKYSLIWLPAKSPQDPSNTADNLVRSRGRGGNGTSRFFIFCLLYVTQFLITEQIVLHPWMIQNLSPKIDKRMEVSVCLLTRRWCYCLISRLITKCLDGRINGAMNSCDSPPLASIDLNRRISSLSVKTWKFSKIVYFFRH